MGTTRSIVADGSAGQHDYHGMQIFDLKHVQEFQGTPLTFSADALYSNFGGGTQYCHQ